MKNSFFVQTSTPAPSVFQVAAHLDEFIAAHPEFVIPLNRHMPFADLMLNPEKVEAVLKFAEGGNKPNGKSVQLPKSTVGGQEDKTSFRAFEKKTKTQ